MVRRQSFFERRSRYAVITAAWDEPEAPRFYQAMQAVMPIDLIVVARGRFLDGYSDETLSKSFGIRTLVVTDEPGQSLAYRRAFAESLADDYQGVIMVDSNGKDDPRALPRFIAALDDGYDLVQGCRYMRGGGHANTPLSRTVAIRMVVPTLLWLGCGHWYRDQTNGFKGFSRRFLEDPRVQLQRSVFVHHNLQPYLNYAAPRLGFRVIEVPASRTYPRGQVPTKLNSKAAQLRLLRDYVRVARGRFNPPPSA